MGIKDAEKEPLVAPTVPAGLARAQASHIAMTLPDAGTERNWKGGLCQCLGDCSPEDCGSCLVATKCLPCAFMHNRKRAFNANAHVWKCAIALGILLYAWIFTSRVLFTRAAFLCTPPAIDALTAPDRPFDIGVNRMSLSGATYQPDKFEPLDGQIPAEVEDFDYVLPTAEGQTEVTAQAFASASASDLGTQIEVAKQQTEAGMPSLNAQLGVGRKLLDKHGHEDKEGKKEKKHKDKKDKKDKKEKKHKDKKVEEHDDDAPWEQHSPHHHGPEPHFGEPSEGCIATIEALHYVAHGSFLLSICFVIYAAMMRTAIRERFGIPGSRLKDCFAWLCCPLCALCQETRTLAANNVRGGVWFGPTVLATSAHPLQAPQPQAAKAEATKAGSVAETA